MIDQEKGQGTPDPGDGNKKRKGNGVPKHWFEDAKVDARMLSLQKGFFTNKYPKSAKKCNRLFGNP